MNCINVKKYYYYKMENTNEKNEIKKLVYTVTPKATFVKVRGGIMYYTSNVEGKDILFNIPLSDTNEADFYPEMDAKYLLRWLVTE